MADDKKLSLNSLDRYSKQSPYLVLEEYSHCEVPAGCGGVVLRWRNPEAGVPVEIWYFTTGKLETLSIDGVQQTMSRPLVPAGQHVLTMRLTGVNLQTGFLMLAALYRAKGSVRSAYQKEGVTTHFLTAADGTWKYSLEVPADASWQTLTYQDAEWSSLAERPLSPIGNEYRHNQIAAFDGK